MDVRFLCFFCAVALSPLQVGGSHSTYRAAVVEYNPVDTGREAERVAANVLRYQTFIKEAKSKGAEIIVFPEGGLTAVETRCYIPDPAEKVVPCDSKDTKYHQVVKDLSCASKNSQIYTVINLVEKRDCAADDENCPPKGFYVFNTNVVFDRTGAVIARYSKYNLFDEYNTDRTKDPEMVFFDTDFGVRFGTFICFDILFPSPAQKLVQQYQITDFVYTTFWFSELPFLTALQAQRGWAETNNVNLLASGVNKPSMGSSGSGIYNGKFGALVQFMPETSTSRLLIADVPTMQNACSRNCLKEPTHSQFVGASIPSANVSASTDRTDATNDDFKLLRDQMNRFKSEVIEPGKTFEKTVCSHDLCCQFEVLMEAKKPDAKNFTCMAVAYNGIRRFGQTFRGGVQSCGVVLCDGPELMNCTSRLKSIPNMFKFQNIQIKGNFRRRNSFQIPSTLTDGNELRPLSANKYEFTRKATEKGEEVSLELLWPVDDLHTFAIWGRDFTRDMGPLDPESGASSAVSLPIVLASFLSFLLFVR